MGHLADTEENQSFGGPNVSMLTDTLYGDERGSRQICDSLNLSVSQVIQLFFNTKRLISHAIIGMGKLWVDFRVKFLN